MLFYKYIEYVFKKYEKIYYLLKMCYYFYFNLFFELLDLGLRYYILL